MSKNTLTKGSLAAILITAGISLAKKALEQAAKGI